jgi:hypothetical protein
MSRQHDLGVGVKSISIGQLPTRANLDGVDEIHQAKKEVVRSKEEKLATSDQKTIIRISRGG